MEFRIWKKKKRNVQSLFSLFCYFHFLCQIGFFLLHTMNNIYFAFPCFFIIFHRFSISCANIYILFSLKPEHSLFDYEYFVWNFNKPFYFESNRFFMLCTESYIFNVNIWIISKYFSSLLFWKHKCYHDG